MAVEAESDVKPMFGLLYTVHKWKKMAEIKKNPYSLGIQCPRS